MFTSPKTATDYEYVYSKDPALDTEHEAYNHEAWLDTKDEAHLPLVAGAKPVRFTLRRLSHRERDLVSELAGTSGAQAGWMLVALSLKAIKPFVVDGEEQEVAKALDSRLNLYRVTDKHMETIRLLDDGDLYAELVGVAQRENYGDPK